MNKTAVAAWQADRIVLHKYIVLLYNIDIIEIEDFIKARDHIWGD